MVGGETGVVVFLACSLDMGQEINGTSNTNANSVSRAAHTAHAYNSQSHAGMFGIVGEPNRSIVGSNRETPLFVRPFSPLLFPD